MKNVAATRGHKVRRTDLFREDTAMRDCSGWVGAVAVANFDGFLLKRLTLATSSPLYRGSRLRAISGHCGGVSSPVLMYGNSREMQEEFGRESCNHRGH